MPLNCEIPPMAHIVVGSLLLISTIGAMNSKLKRDRVSRGVQTLVWLAFSPYALAILLNTYWAIGELTS